MYSVRNGPDSRFRGNVYAPTARHRRDGLAIGPGTTVPDWHGEVVDDSMAMGRLLQRD